MKKGNSAEAYLESILTLHKEKGYARSVDTIFRGTVPVLFTDSGQTLLLFPFYMIDIIINMGIGCIHPLIKAVKQNSLYIFMSVKWK